MTKTKKEYLGDGLYVIFDGYGITLTAPRENGDHWVYLEPSVFAQLMSFVESLKAEDNDARETDG